MPRIGEYRAKLTSIDADLAGVHRRYSAESYTAALAVAAAVLAAYLAFVPRVLPRLTIVPFPVWFAYSLRRVRSAALRGRTLRCYRRFYERGVARLDHRWMGQGIDGEAYLEPAHLYARDLDLFGEGSLFELVCTTPTAFGHRALAGWLQAPASREMALARQRAVRELREEPDLRAGLSVAGDSYALQVGDEELRRWLRQPDRRISPFARIGLLLLTLSFVAWLILWLGGFIAAPLCYVVVGALGAAQLAAGLALRRRVAALIEAVGMPSTSFASLAALFRFLAVMKRFESALLAQTCARFSASPAGPGELDNLRRLVRMLESRNSDEFYYPSLILLWGTHWSFAIEAWRVRYKDHFLERLDALATFEALCALATFAYERSGSCFPELAGEGNCFDAVGLEHPLLPAEASVGNDIALGDAMQLAVISGSNMSGKSTFLKAIGLAVVLAWAGGPVAAKRLRVSRFAVTASTKVEDSLHDRKSRFFSEAERIGKILELARHAPGVLYLFDEMLGGTNSHDRRLGAEAILSALVEAGAIGAITTHDLAIAEAVERLGERACNVHFADSIVAGCLEFDYRLRPGIVRTRNALAVLRICGIRVG